MTVLEVVGQRDSHRIGGAQEVLGDRSNPAAIGNCDWTIEAMSILSKGDM
jgi:hypothetical protein